LIKEVAYYGKEVQQNEAKLKAMKEDQDNKYDSYDIKKFEEVLGESYMMVPDSQQRLQRALEDLQNFCNDAAVVEVAAKAGEGEWHSIASTILKEHAAVAAGNLAAGNDSANDDDDNNNAIDDPPCTSIEGLAEGEAY